MKVLVLSGAFPSVTRPAYAVFVRERVRHVAARADVEVVAPVPWFPFNRWLRGEAVAATPRTEHQGRLLVRHPRFLCTPFVGKTLDALLCAVTLVPFVVRLRRRFPFDVIDAHFSYPDGVAAVILGKLLGTPAVITLRGTHDLRNAGFRLRASQIRWALAGAARVVTVSDSLRRFAERMGIDPHKIRVIPNGVDGERFTPGDQAEARARLGLSPDRPVLLSVGALVEGKGHQRVVEALPQLLARHPNLLYVVVGGDGSGVPSERGTLEAAIRQTALEGHVKLVGARPHDEVSTWMAAADLFCLATRSEGWCNALTESLACGLPVVTTTVGGNAEVVRDDDDGFLVPFWDEQAFVRAVLRALDRPWDRAGIAARAHRHTWQRTADAVVDVLAEATTCTEPTHVEAGR
jgi:glycosyltransferase involved in cell wall biosynthesis